MIGIEPPLLELGECAVVALIHLGVAIQIGQRLIEREDADILQQRREKYLLGHGLAQRVGERARRGRRDQRPAPIERVVDAVRLAGAQRLHQGEAQRQRQGRVQSEHDQRLAQILALAPLGVEGRVRDAQHLGGQRGVHAEHLGHFAHLDIRIARELDDMSRDARRGREVHQRAKVGFYLGIQGHSNGASSAIAYTGLASGIRVT